MKNILKNRLALSTVVTTLIILVVSVLLAGVVTYYAINVTSTRVQEESLSLTYLHVWYNPSGVTTGPPYTTSSPASECALAIINTGGRDVVINKITVRGQSADFANVYTAVASPTTDLAYSADLAHVYYAGSGASDTTIAAGTSGKEITLSSGDTLIVYISSPDSITINDIGLTVGVTVFTSQAMYYQECNVQAYIPPAG
jgi:hypothetical protein